MPIEFERATPVFGSADYDRSRDFYTAKLGFEVVEEGGDPARFGIFRRGTAFLFIDAWNGPPTPTAGKWDAYFHVNELSSLCAEYERAGITISRMPQETVYGMREFEITDPDGNVICFGEDME